MTINDSNEAVLGSLTQLGDGVDGGSLVAGSAASGQSRTHFLIEQGKNLIGRGNVVGNVRNNGHVIGDGAFSGERIVFDAGGTVSGIGRFENVRIDGTFAPGLSPGVVDGANVAVGGTLAIELGGATPGNGLGHHDQINDAGAFTIVPGATLALQWHGGYLPTPGQEFEILTAAGGIDGSFASLVVDPWFIANGVGFSLDQSIDALLATSIAVSGDFTLDGVVDGSDLLAWQRTAGQSGANLMADGDDNGVVDAADLDIWRIQFAAAHGESVATTRPVPEPTSWWIIVVGSLLLSGVHRRA